MQVELWQTWWIPMEAYRHLRITIYDLQGILSPYFSLGKGGRGEEICIRKKRKGSPAHTKEFQSF